MERIGEHGLFTDAGKPVILADVQKEVSRHKGPVWTHVVSLRREDAARLGYLKADVKRLVDQIVDELAKDPAVSEALFSPAAEIFGIRDRFSEHQMLPLLVWNGSSDI